MSDLGGIARRCCLGPGGWRWKAAFREFMILTSAGLPALRSTGFQVVFGDEAIERVAADFQHPCGASLVPLLLVQHL